MKNYMKQRLLYFSVSFLISFTLFASVISVCLISPNKEIFVAEQNLKESYYAPPLAVLNKKYLVEITDLPLYFYISLNSSTSECTVITIPKNSVKNSTVNLDTTEPLKGCEKFFSLSPDTLISINSSALEQFVNLSGGVNMPTPYGITAPASSHKFIAAHYTAMIFGCSFLSIINDDDLPNQNRMSYYSEIICRALESILSDFSQKDLAFFNEKIKLSISYVDYYNNHKSVENCFKKLCFSAPEGVWIQEKYFLK